jgi:hypothetical protein
MWGSLTNHAAISSPQPNRKPDRAQPTPLWSLPDLVVVSISELLCRPCALHEGRIRVGALCRWSWVYGCWCLGLADLGPLVGACQILQVPAIAAGRVSWDSLKGVFSPNTSLQLIYAFPDPKGACELPVRESRSSSSAVVSATRAQPQTPCDISLPLLSGSRNRARSPSAARQLRL